ncbi:citramalate synthase [Candidatus Woesearchaeota archaeon]|nr:citramalate synthase [Candidatus Woesearchaeota archaeon]
MIKLFDTTLRDGTQSVDVNLSTRDKIKIAEALDSFGIDYIELGWPGSNPKDMDTFLEAAKLGLNRKVVAFGATRRKGIKASEDANLQAILKSKAGSACIFGKTWLHHVDRQLRMDSQENLKAVRESIMFLKEKGLYVFYDLEHFFDGFKDSKEYALECLEAAGSAGADCLVLCDTNGGSLPDEVKDIVKEVKGFMDKNKVNSRLGVHFHNDSGTAVANTLAAVDLGIDEVQGTVNGFGERTGNADLCQLIPLLVLKKDIKLDVDLKRLTELSKLVYTLSNMRAPGSQPFVGKNAFSHKGGIHVDAVMKGASYEHVDPELIGNKRSIVLSDLSGKANIVEVAKKFGFDVKKDSPGVSSMLHEVEIMEKKGYDIRDLKAEQLLLAESHFGRKRDFFNIETWKIMSEQRNGEFSESVVTGRVDGKEREVVAPIKGGPVAAVFTAVMKMISTNYKQIKDVKLINYKVMIAEDKGAESTVRVYIEFKNGKEEWGTVGVSTNILEASLEAIEKGFRYFLVKSS